MTKLSWLVLITLAPYLCDAYKFLVVYPMPARSHAILGDGFVRILLEAGHEVTYVTAFPKKDPPKNLHQIDVSGNLAILREDIYNIQVVMKDKYAMRDLDMLYLMLNGVHELTYQNENVQRLLNDPTQHFDLAIIEWMFIENLAGFAAAFNVPYIWSSSVDPHWMVLRLVDDITNPAYVPDIQSDYSPPFNFLQRTGELWSILKVLARDKMSTVEEDMYEKYFGPVLAKKGRRLPPYEELMYNASLMFSNSHFSMGQATRLPQNVIPIGGYHIEPKVKPLPANLQKLLDESTDGLIYFSMGSNLKSALFPEELKRGMLKVFSELKQTVLWKFEEQIDNLPKNVHIVSWAPQQSILAHPNCILFITHGGLLSTTEAVHNEVPLVGIPVFADQYVNVDRAVKKGYSIKVDLAENMVPHLKAAILEAITNSSYKNKVKELSQAYHHRVAPPAAEVLHWTEHVILTRGAPLLRSPALALPFYQKLFLDLAALLLIALVLVVVVIRIVIKRLFCKRSDKKKFE